jgi:hypothetical protein
MLCTTLPVARWTRARSALVAFLAMTLLVVGATTRPVPLAPQAAPHGSTVDKSSTAKSGIRPGQTGLRVASASRSSRPLLGGGALDALILAAPVALSARPAASDPERAHATSPRSLSRFSHRPRGPPNRA